MKSRINYGICVRVTLDVILLLGSLLVSFVLRYLYGIVWETNETTTGELLRLYIENFVVWGPALIVLGLSSFATLGVYTRGRSYGGRAKALMLLRAATVPYLLLPMVLYIFPGYFTLPRSVLFISWCVTTIGLVFSRLWSNIWRHLVILENAGEVRAARDEKFVLLIGGAGYIGSALVPRLLEAGYKVRLLDVFLYGREPLQSVLNHPRLEIVEGDFRQIEKVVSSMRGVGTVIHLGGLVGDPACALDEQLTTEINLMATRVIAEVARGEGVRRFVFASTCSVYGASDGILDENSKLNPISLYARSKIASERVLLEMSDTNFCPVILRFGTIFGLSGRTRFDLVVNLLAAKAVFDGKITLHGGDQWRPFVHVDDAGRAIFSSLESDLASVAGEVFNIGGNSLNYTLRDVGEMIQKMVPSAELLELGANADRRNYRVDFSKVHRVLKYLPKWTLEEGIAQVIDAIRSGKVQDYSLPKYSNVKFLNDEKIRILGKDGGWERRVLDDIGPSEHAITQR